MAVLAGLSGVGTIIEQNKVRESRVWQRVRRCGAPFALAEVARADTSTPASTRPQSYSHYIENYPLEPAVLGFVTYPFILDNGCAQAWRVSTADSTDIHI